jgi:hypothetical protein
MHRSLAQSKIQKIPRLYTDPKPAYGSMATSMLCSAQNQPTDRSGGDGAVIDR